MTIEQEPMSNKDAKIEECKFFKKVYLGKHCELFKSPCYGTACNFHKEFIKLTQLESENNRLREALEEILAQKEMCVLSKDDVYFGMCEYCSVDWCPKYIAQQALK